MSEDLIIDCDTGSDDAIALLVGALHPDLNLIAVTTVAGNCPVEITTLNTLKVLESAAISGVPVYRGADGPLIGQIDRSAGWPQDLDLPEPSIAAEPVHAVDFLVETLATAETPITLAAVGPLTNLALAFRMRPGIVSNIERIAIMGGGIAVSNISASAEANIYWDPEAADVVFRAGAPIEMFPLDATHMAPVTSGDVARWAEAGTPAALTAAAFLPERIHMYESRMPVEGGGAPVHDALAVGALVDPDLVRFERANVEIELHGTLTRGRTVVDQRPHTFLASQPKNARVAVWADRERFLDFLSRIFHSQESGDDDR
ncbi:MAG: nucleoside hydrolase [bacterium]|nr:nucleoside hydrolase [bacterium]MDE0288080.1 nucleoside hydrolase [bacterium]MDE0377184.1 nucleoside hydrolase [bacterium]